MEPTLRGVDLKLYRAHEHYGTLRDESPNLVEGNRVRHSTIAKAHPDGRGYNFDLPPLKPFDADRWSLVLGDFLFNLRSALDQLVYQLHLIAFDGAIPEKVERASAFPIKRYLPRTGKGRVVPLDKWPEIKNLPDVQRTEIERFQPYLRWDDEFVPQRAALLMVDMLNNIDKHRRLHVVRHVVRSTWSPSFPARYGFVSKPKWDAAVVGGAKVDEWRFKFISEDLRDRLAHQVDMHSVALEEVLDEPRIVIAPVYELVRTLHNGVLKTIREFVPFFRDAGVPESELELPGLIPSAYGELAERLAEWRRWQRRLDIHRRRLEAFDRRAQRFGRGW